MTLTVVMITKDCAGVVGEALESVKGLWDELLVDDDGSTDGTREILRKYKATIIASHKKNLGERKQGLVEQATGDWILVLDADERVSEELRAEILEILNGSRIKSGMTKGWRIPYQNYVFGEPVYYGGEAYGKVRLFRKGYGRVFKTPLHEEIEIKGPTPLMLRGVIHHYSYRSFGQLFKKFTKYAEIASSSFDKLRIPRNDRIKKLFLYGPHMFWARFVKDGGYKDGWRGFVLALAFAYMEALTYVLLFLRKK